MQALARLKEQHMELVQLAREISLYLEPDKLLTDTRKVRNLLSKLAFRIEDHQVVEDRLIYPSLLENAREEVSTIAEQFREEMEWILEEFSRYNRKWERDESITDDALTFIEETNSVINELGKRINKEDNILFTLID
jgi:iron-sulfur cluster repair protein YtfE (RIC family)